MRGHSVYRRVEQWEIYDRIAGHGIYADVEKEFLPDERYDWTLLAEIELFRSAIGGSKKVLDIGCGTGHPSLHIARDVGSIIGIDKSERMIEIARNKLKWSGTDNIVFEVGDATALRFLDESFDAVILCGSLATLSDKMKSLQEIRRVLKENGEVACVEANWLYKSTHERCFEGEGGFVLTKRGSIRFRCVRRSVRPNKEVDYRCIIDLSSALGKKLLSNPHFLKHKTLETEMGIDDVEPYCDEIEYDEQEGFDAETIGNLFAENGFKDIITHGYGVMYDLLDSEGLVDKMGSCMRRLSRAEATISSFLNPLKTEMLFLTCKRDSTTAG